MKKGTIRIYELQKQIMTKNRYKHDSDLCNISHELRVSSSRRSGRPELKVSNGHPLSSLSSKCSVAKKYLHSRNSTWKGAREWAKRPGGWRKIKIELNGRSR